MSVGWERLPLLPLRCVLEHLCQTDALAAMTTCRHWRTVLLLFEGHKDLLRLRTKQTEKNVFLARMFRKNVRRLHIYVDCGGEELLKFYNTVLPIFFEAAKLKEILFVGPSYLQQNFNTPATKLNRVITESLVLKLSHSLETLALFGCEIDVANKQDRYMHEQIEYYTSHFSFNEVSTAADRLLSSSNTNHIVFSNLQHIAVDYEQINTESMATLSHLPMFSQLSVTISSKNEELEPIDWDRLAPCYPTGLDVAVNIIGLPLKRFQGVMDNVLVEGLPLVSLKVLYCKTVYNALLTHVVSVHKATLRELVWADCPHAAAAGDLAQRVVSNRDSETDSCHMNPFIFLCWQCHNLRRLVVHGYWFWQYDLLGCVRLSKSLRELEISAICRHPYCGTGLRADEAIRVMAGDACQTILSNYVHQVNELTTPIKWVPIPFQDLPPGLQARPSPEDKAQYLMQELTRTTDTMNDM